ncbi:hypothetical protein IT408_00990 [Candidatus Uhrbacteria bacterium]|nr:hypothetical protein [Candidatus Uhrbacteria bacterium]
MPNREQKNKINHLIKKCEILIVSLSISFCLLPTEIHAALIDPKIQEKQKINTTIQTATGTLKIEEKVSPFEPIFPELNIRIPGLKFGDTTLNPAQEITVPYLGQYIAAIYKYLIGASIIVAAVMIAYGGFLYIVSSSGISVSQGKEYIKDALIGLFLVLAANTILFTLRGQNDPLNALKVKIIRKQAFSYLAGNQDAPNTLGEMGIQPRSRNPDNVAPDNERTCDPNLIDTDSDDPKAAAAKANCSAARSGSRSQAGSGSGSPGKSASKGKAKPNPDKEYIPPPSTAKYPTDLTIPKECPGRDPLVNPKEFAMLGKVRLYPSSRLALYDKKRNLKLDEKVIMAYLKEQSLTGVPAGTLLGQMLTETWNKCVLLSLFEPTISSCGGGDATKYYNFGGIGCTAKDVPSDICPNVAFGTYFIIGQQSQKMSISADDPNGPNPRFNRFIPGRETVCMEAARSSSRANYNNCGPKCYPQKSHASARFDGNEYWYESVQCSRKFDSPQEFLANHLGFIKYCMPYNDSVYKFAYCIGASTYAGVTGDKGPLIAAIIERNCLCGSKDSSGCKRDIELEQKLKNGVIKKRNLFVEGATCIKRDQETNKCLQRGAKPNSEIDYANIITSLKEIGIDPKEAPGDVSGVLYAETKE